MSDRILARLRNMDYGVETDHGWPMVLGRIEMEDGRSFSLGYQADTAFVMRFLAAVGADSMRNCDGKSIWITLADKNNCLPNVEKIEPLHAKDGTPFIIAEWQDWMRDNGHSPYEYRTGKKS